MARSTEAAPDAEQIAVGLIVADGGRLLLQHRDDTPGLPGAVSATNRYCVAIDWQAAIARIAGTE